MSSVLEELKVMQSVTDMENLAKAQKEVVALVDATYQAKLDAAKAEAKYKGLKAELDLLMERAGIDKIAGNECNASRSVKYNTSVPKDLKEKRELFEWIKKHEGPEALGAMLTINARSFTSWYNALVEARTAAGELDFKLPMLTPYEVTTVGLRKKTKKAK